MGERALENVVTRDDCTCNFCTDCLPLTTTEMKFDPRCLFVPGASISVRPMANESPNQFWLLPTLVHKTWHAVNYRHSYCYPRFDPEMLLPDELTVGNMYGFYDSYGDSVVHRARFDNIVEYEVYDVFYVDSGKSDVGLNIHQLMDIPEDLMKRQPMALECQLMVNHVVNENGIVDPEKFMECIQLMEALLMETDLKGVSVRCIGPYGKKLLVELELPAGDNVKSLLLETALAELPAEEYTSDRQLINGESEESELMKSFQSGSKVEVTVSCIRSLHSIWVIPEVVKKEIQSLQQECPFGQEVDWWSIKRFSNPPSQPVSKGKMYWAQNSEGVFVRAIITKIENVRRYMGRTLDCGHMMECNPECGQEMAQLSDDFLFMPPLVVECCLDVLPTDGADSRWSKESLLYFHHVFSNGVFPYCEGYKTYSAIPTGRVKQGRIQVILKDGDKDIAEELIKKEYAVRSS